MMDAYCARWHGARTIPCRVAHSGPGAGECGATEERMADVNTRGTRRGSGGSTLILGLLVLAVLALVLWLVMRGGGDDADVEVNVPQVEAPDVDVNVKSN